MHLKRTLLILSAALFSITISFAQNVGIGTSTPGAKLDVNSTNSGILIPRVALTGTASSSPLTSPTTSTMVYNTANAGSGATAVTPGFYYWNSSTWVRVIDNSSLTGATTVSNTSSTNILTTTVDGVTGIGVAIVNSNALSLSGTSITSTVNGIGSSPLDLSSLDNNIYNSNGTLTGARTVTMAANSLTLSSTSGNLIFNSTSGGNMGIGTASPSALLHLVSPNATGTSVQLRLAPTGGGSSTTSVPSLVDFYSTFDAYSADQGPRRTASIKGAFSGGTWGNEALLFEVGTGAGNDAAAEPTERMRINGAGQVRIASLAGTGYRPVYTDASGNLYAISGSSSNKQTFSYTGANQTFTVPSGVNIIYVKLWGAGGASAYSTGDGPGGAGGFVSGFMSVTPGASLTVIVGRGGIAGTNSSANSGTQSTGGSGTIYGGGGLAGHGYSGTGGGRSAIQIVSGTDAVTAGAGGGGSKNNIRWGAGGGGGLIGAAGSMGQIYNGGSGGTQSAGGIEIWNGTSSQNTCAGNPGSLYQGGRGCTANDGSGGGGGGYYGGAGGGGGGDGPSGGGSSYISGLLPYMPIRNEQGMTVNNYNAGYTVVQSVLIQPGGTDGTDYVSGIGVGGTTVTSGTTGINGGNGQVVIYW